MGQSKEVTTRSLPFTVENMGNTTTFANPQPEIVNESRVHLSLSKIMGLRRSIVGQNDSKVDSCRPPLTQDVLCSDDILETSQEQNRLEISGVRMYFEPEGIGDCNSKETAHHFFDMPSNEPMVKLFPVSNDQDMLQITLLLEDFEKDHMCDISRKELSRDIQMYNFLPQDEYICEKYEIPSHQPMQITRSENLDLCKECGRAKNNGFVKTDNCSSENTTITSAEASTSTDTNVILRCSKTTQTDLKETKHNDSPTETFNTNLALMLSSQAHIGSISSPKAFKHCSVQCDSNADNCYLKTTSNSSAQTSVSTETTSPLRYTTATKRTTSMTTQTILRETRHSDVQTETFATDLTYPCQIQSLIENISPKANANCDVQCDKHNKGGFLDTSSSSMETVQDAYVETSTGTSLPLRLHEITLQRTSSTTTQTDLKETRDSNSQTDMNTVFSTDIIHSWQTQLGNASQSKESCSRIPTSEINNQALNEPSTSALHSWTACPKPDTVLLISQKPTYEIDIHTKKDISLGIQNLQQYTSHIAQYLEKTNTVNFERGIAGKKVSGKKVSCGTIKKTTKENHFLRSKDSEKQKKSNLGVKVHKISFSRSKFPNVSETGVQKRSRHPILPCRIYKHASSRKTTNRQAPRRNSLTFNPKNSVAITSEGVSLVTTSTENKRKHPLNPTPTTDVKKHLLNPTSTRNKRNDSRNPTPIKDHKKYSLNPTLAKEERKYSLHPTLIRDVEKPSLNQTSTRDDKKHLSSKTIKGETKQSMIPILTADDTKSVNPTSTRNVLIHSFNSSPIRGDRKYSLNPTPISGEKYSLLPIFVRNARKHSPAMVKDYRKQSQSLKMLPAEEYILAKCVKGDSVTERVFPIPLRISTFALEWRAKSFHFLRTDPVELILNPARIEFVECPPRDLCHFRSVNCIKMNDNVMQEISKVHSVMGSESLNSESVCTGESEGAVVTVIFRRKSHADSETNQHFEVCLCDDCYTKTQSTVDEYLTSGSGNVPAGDGVELKPFPIESSSASDTGTQQENETAVGTDISDVPSVKSLIENLYPLCEVINDYLLDLKEVDEDLLRQSINTLAKRWLTVAADRYSTTKEVYNYLQYFQKFSDNLTKFILHFTDPEDNNVLHFAYGNNRFDMAEELLNNKNGPELLKKRNKLGHTPLMICAISQPENKEDWMTVKKSVKLGNVNEVSQSSGQTALMNAASRGSGDMVRILLEAGADPNQCDADGSTALMYATEQGREACVSMLLDHPECDPLIKDQDGQTASSIAIGAGHKDIALLIYLQIKKMPYKTVHQVMKAHKKKNPPSRKSGY